MAGDSLAGAAGSRAEAAGPDPKDRETWIGAAADDRTGRVSAWDDYRWVSRGRGATVGVQRLPGSGGTHHGEDRRDCGRGRGWPRSRSPGRDGGRVRSAVTLLAVFDSGEDWTVEGAPARARMLPDRGRETAAPVGGGAVGRRAATAFHREPVCSAEVRLPAAGRPVVGLPGPRRAAIPADRPRGPVGQPAVDWAEARRRRRKFRLPRPIRTEAACGSASRSVRLPKAASARSRAGRPISMFRSVAVSVRLAEVMKTEPGDMPVGRPLPPGDRLLGQGVGLAAGADQIQLQGGDESLPNSGGSDFRFHRCGESATSD